MTIIFRQTGELQLNGDPCEGGRWRRVRSEG